MQKLRLNVHNLVPTSYGLLAATQTNHQIARTNFNQISTGTAATRQIYFLNNITSAYLPKSAQIDLGLIPPGFPRYGTPIKAHPPASVTMFHPCLRMAVFLQAHDDVIKWKHFPCYCTLCREFTGHRWIPLSVNSSHKGQWRVAVMCSLVWPEEMVE